MSILPSDPGVRGPWAVGVATREVPDPADPDRRLVVDVWYPADPARSGAAPPADHPFGRPHPAVVEPPAAPGRFPLVAFSHGNSGMRRQSTFLTTHLASWGLVVTAPDHAGNTFPEMLAVRTDDERVRVHRAARHNRPRDLDTAIDLTLAGDGPWADVDPDRVGALGHSFGGWTALKMPARGRRVRAVCGLAPASEPFVGRRAFDPGELPLPAGVPALVVAGIDDVLVDLATSVRPLFERLGPASALVGVEDADHFHFCDGIELLHGMHERNPRPRQPRPTRPYAEQLPEERMHRALRALVAGFFLEALAEARVGETRDPLAAWTPARLAGLDPALRRLDRDRPGAAA